MSDFSRRFRFRLLGIAREFEYLDSEDLQRAAWRAVADQVNRDRFVWLPYVLLPVLFPPIGLFFVRPIGSALRVASIMPPWVFDTIVMTAIGLILGYGSVWIARRRYRSVLRAHLNVMGVPTCLHCGYNLTGAAAARCPECGTATQRTAE